MSFQNVLSSDLRELRPVQVLEQSFKKGRFPHAILLHGLRLDMLESVAMGVAAALLRMPAQGESHADLFVARPSNKMRQIHAEQIRNLIADIQHSPALGHRKVAILYEADRLNPTAANAFLKTLEEPPLNTTILLVTTRPYALLDTIRSRCLNFKIPCDAATLEDPLWNAWKEQYQRWITNACTYTKNKAQAGSLVIEIYGLTYRFELLLESMSDTFWQEEEQKQANLGLPADEKVALEAGVRKRLRDVLFAQIEVFTRDAVIQDIELGNNKHRAFQLTRAVKALEEITGLLEVNLRESAALEAFLLESLSIWTLQS